jgi:hypothetical protein
MYAVPGVQKTGAFTPSRTVRVRSITVTGLDPKVAFLATSEYGFWDGQTPLPSFASETDPLPVSVHSQAIRGAFSIPAHTNVFIRLVLRAIGDAQVPEEITGIRVDAESWSWAHTTFIPFQDPVRLVPPR